MSHPAPLPPTLRRRIENLSSTVQALFAEVMLHVTGEREPQVSGAERATRAQVGHRCTVDDLDLLGDTLPKNADALAYATAYAAGRRTQEIADFFGVQYDYCKRRIQTMMRAARRLAPKPEDFEDA